LGKKKKMEVNAEGKPKDHEKIEVKNRYSIDGVADVSREAENGARTTKGPAWVLLSEKSHHLNRGGGWGSPSVREGIKQATEGEGSGGGEREHH